MKIINFICVLLLILGGLNWFLIGAFGINIVSIFFGHSATVSRAIYIVIGLAAFNILLNIKKHF